MSSSRIYVVFIYSLTNVGGIYKKLGLHNQAERKANSSSAIIQKLIHSIDWLLLWIQSSYLLSQNGKKKKIKGETQIFILVSP